MNSAANCGANMLRNLDRKTVKVSWEYTYIVSGNEPCHFCVGSQLAVDETLYLALGPTIVDVNNGQHVPLKMNCINISQKLHSNCVDYKINFCG